MAKALVGWLSAKHRSRQLGEEQPAQIRHPMHTLGT